MQRRSCAVPPCIILMAPVRNVDDASIYLIQRGACGRVRHILHNGFHLPPALCHLRNMTFFRSSLFIFKLKLSYRLQTLLSTINFISDGNIFHNPPFHNRLPALRPKVMTGKSFTLSQIRRIVHTILHSKPRTFHSPLSPISELWKSGIIQYHRTSKS